MAKDDKKINERGALKKTSVMPKEKTKEKPEKQAAEKKEKKKEEKLPPSDAKAVADAFSTIKFVLMTEKSIRMVESQNKLVFIVNRSSKKEEIKKAVQHAFESPVSEVKTVIDQAGRKKAFVKFTNPGAAGDIAIKLGVI